MNGRSAGLTYWLITAPSEVRTRATRALDAMPAWQKAEQLCGRALSPLHRALAWLASLPPLAQPLECLGLRQFLSLPAPLVVAAALCLLAFGCTPSHFGHLATHTFRGISVYSFLSFLSTLNPLLGALAALAFGAGDLAQKLAWDDVYYHGSRTAADWAAARLGYILSYSAPLAYGILPGLLGRVGQHIGRRAFQTLPAGILPVAAPSAGSLLGGVLGFMGGAMAGAWGAGQIVRTLEWPAFIMRPHPDLSCYEAEVGIIKSQVPQTVGATVPGTAAVILGGMVPGPGVDASDSGPSAPPPGSGGSGGPGGKLGLIVPPILMGAPHVPPPPESSSQPGAIAIFPSHAQIRLRGDGKANVTVHVAVKKLENGAWVDAPGAANVIAQTAEKAIGMQKVGSSGVDFTVYAVLMGTQAKTAFIRVVAAAAGAVVDTKEITVEIEPIPAVVRLTVKKKGFETLYHDEPLRVASRELLAKLQGRLDADTPWEYVVDAPWKAELNVDNGGWTLLGDGSKTNAEGEIRVPLPQMQALSQFVDELVVHEPSKPLEFKLDSDTSRQVDDFKQTVPTLPDTPDYAGAREKCRAYPRHAFKQLCELPEDRYERAMSALNLLRMAMRYAVMGRRDFAAHCQAVSMACEDVFASFVDALLEVSGVAEKLFKSDLRVSRDLLRKGAEAIDALPGGWLLVKGVKLVVDVTYALVNGLFSLLGKFIEFLAEKAMAKAGVSLSRHLLGIDTAAQETWPMMRRFMEKLGFELSPPAGGRQTNVDLLADLLSHAFSLLLAALHLAMFLLKTVLWAVAIFLVYGLKVMAGLAKVIMSAFADLADTLVVKVCHAFQWIYGSGAGGAVNWRTPGLQNTLHEALEQLIGDIAGALFDAVAGFIGLIGDLSVNVSNRLQLGQSIMNALPTQTSFDRAAAAILEQAHGMSSTLAVPRDWRAAQAKVSRVQVQALTDYRDKAGWVEFAEMTGAGAKFGVKIVQGIVFAMSQVTESGLQVVAARVLGAKWSKLGGLVGFAGKLEMAVAVTELVMIRTPIVAWETFCLARSWLHAGATIMMLYDRGGDAQP